MGAGARNEKKLLVRHGYRSTDFLGRRIYFQHGIPANVKTEEAKVGLRTRFEKKFANSRWVMFFGFRDRRIHV